MKCTNKKIIYPPDVTTDCNGEMREVGNIGEKTSAPSSCIIYQCEICKTIQLQ